MSRLVFLLTQLELTDKQKFDLKWAFKDLLEETPVSYLVENLSQAIVALENGFDFYKVKEFWQEGKWINAIKEYRAITGADLKEAKEAVETMMGETVSEANERLRYSQRQQLKEEKNERTWDTSEDEISW